MVEQERIEEAADGDGQHERARKMALERRGEPGRRAPLHEKKPQQGGQADDAGLRGDVQVLVVRVARLGRAGPRTRSA